MTDTFAQQERERERQEHETAAKQAEARSRQLAAVNGLPHQGEADRPGHWMIKPSDLKQWREAGWLISGTVNGTEPLFIMREPLRHQNRR